MEIKLQKEEKLDGEIWYKVWAGNTCVDCFKEIDEMAELLADGKSKAYHEAKATYEKTVQRHKDGFPKTETLSITVIE